MCVWKRNVIGIRTLTFDKDLGRHVNHWVITAADSQWSKTSYKLHSMKDTDFWQLVRPVTP